MEGETMRKTNVTRRTLVGVAALAALGCGCSADKTSTDTASTDEATSSDAAAGAITGTYDRFVQGDDWGCGVKTVTLTLDAPLDTVDVTTFAVSETKDATDWTDPEFAVTSVTNELPVADAYVVEGNIVNIEIAIDPNTASPFNFSPITGRNTWTPYTMDIKLADGAVVTSDGKEVASLEIDPAWVNTTTSADMFEKDSFTASDDTSYNYAYYDAEGSDTLVVWLHGGGEGGAEGIETDPSIVLLANEAANLGMDDFQKAVGGASVLVPQCPTFWMDNGHLTGGPVEIVMGADDQSLYTASLEELIDSYKEKVQAKKVVLVGCSNGGYMTLLLAKERPDAYDVLVPICGPLKEEYFTDDQIAAIKDKPIFMVWSKADTTVDPSVFELPLIERLEKAGATDLHTFNPDDVHDTSGRFTQPDSSDPYVYDGHWSWIYFFNNEAVDADGQGAWDFIAERVQ